jgi:hypothetical protein
MIPAAHAENPRDGAADVENLGVLEDRFIVVGRADHRGDHTARGHLDLHVSKRLALQGTTGPLNLSASSKRIGRQRQIVGDEAHLLRVFQEAIQGQRKRLRR